MCCTIVLLFAMRCCSPLHPTTFLSVSHYCFPFRATMLLSSSHRAIILLFTPHYCSPLRVALLLSSLRCCCLFHLVVFLFVHYYSPLRPITLLFVHCYFLLHPTALLFNCSSILSTRFFVLPLLWVCCYSLKNLVLPPHILSCKNWE
jgi:hypothetical protein